MPRAPSHPKRLSAAEKRAAVLHLRRQGKTYDLIERETGIPASTSRSIIHVYLQRLGEESREHGREVLAMIEARCFHTIETCYEKGLQGDEAAWARYESAEERLLKLYSPSKSVTNNLLWLNQQSNELTVNVQGERELRDKALALGLRIPGQGVPDNGDGGTATEN